MYVDFKITTWERIYVPDERKKEMFAKIQSGEITTSNELIDHQNEYFEFTFELLEGADEPMTVEENDGWSTLEVLDDDKNTIWCNGKESL